MPSNYPLLRSLEKEEQTEVEATITGTIPSWVSGTLFRNGPGRYEYGGRSFEHLFDGHACIHKFRIENGKVYYSNKFLETEHYNKVKKEKRLYPAFGTSDVCSNIFGRFQAFYNGTKSTNNINDNTNVNIVPYGNQHLYALTETNMICKLDPKNLNILRTINVTNYIPSATSTFAHPHILDDGGWFIMGMNTKGKIPHYNIIKYTGGKDSIDAENICEQGSVFASIPSSHTLGMNYFHSFGMSQNYFIFLEHSLIFDFKGFLIGIVTNRSVVDNLYMKKKWKTRIHLVNRRTGEITKQEFRTEPLFVFHHTNAYEKYDANGNCIELIVDICAYDTDFDIKKMSFKHMYTTCNIGGLARRITIPMNAEPTENTPIFCKIETLNKDLLFEFPTINYERVNGLPYKYFYGTNIFKGPYSVIKQNVEDTSEILEFKYGTEGKKFMPSEPVFVENPNPQSEDDGVLLVMVIAEDRDYLSVLDAKNLKEIARADLPDEAKSAFATTFHGFFAARNRYEKLNEV